MIDSGRIKQKIFALVVALSVTLLVVWSVQAQSPFDPAFGSNIKSDSQKEIPAFVPGELLVKFKSETGPAVRENTLQKLGGRTLKPLLGGRWLRVQIPAGQEMAAQAWLLAQPAVAAAGPNYLLTIAQTPNDPKFATEQWNLNNTGQTGGTPDADIDGPEAWDIHTGGSNAIVAIADSGIDFDHEDLIDRIWTNPGEIPNNNIDDDNNGYIDDVNGYDFRNSDNDPEDDNGHGTHVSGIAGASGNNGKGISGLGWNLTLMPLKVTSSSGSASLADAVEAIEYAADNGAAVVNLSLVSTSLTPPCPSSFDVIQAAGVYAQAKNTLVVFAAGNQGDSQIHCPANYPAVMAVGSTTKYDFRSGSSNYGPQLDVVAPGDSIYSTARTGSYETRSGTSMAAPHVAGLTGLLTSFSPALKAQDVRTIIQTSADDKGAAGRDDSFGHGRINAQRSLDALVQLRLADDAGSLSLLLADNDPSALPKTATIELLSANPGDITYTTSISPAVSWLSVAAPGGFAVTETTLVATVVATRPTPAVPGTYTTTVVFSAATTGGQPLGLRTVDVRLVYVAKAEFTYLPLVFRGYRIAPDLVLENVVAATGGVTVTIKNQGDAPVKDAFWVDVYFDPNQIPNLNQPWPTIANHGVVWGITAPLAPGESLVLTTNGDFYYPQYSSRLPLPEGAAVYAFADSINYSTSYGNVLEQNESNNLSQKTVSTQSVSVDAAILPLGGQADALPPR